METIQNTYSDGTGQNLPGVPNDDAKAKPRRRRVGRPTKYRPHYCQDIETYFNAQIAKGDYPCIAGFAGDVCHIAEKNLYAWADQYPEFRKSLDHALAISKRYLLEKGLKRDFDPGMVKFVAINCHDMVGEHSKTDTNANVILSTPQPLQIRWADKT